MKLSLPDRIFDLVRKLGFDSQAGALEGRPSPVVALGSCHGLKVAFALANLFDALVSAVLGEVRRASVASSAQEHSRPGRRPCGRLAPVPKQRLWSSLTVGRLLHH